MSDVMDARRDAFERKYPMLEGMYWCEERKRYVGNHLFWLYQDRWECWNTAIDSVCVDVPDSSELVGDSGRETYRIARDEFMDALDSAGVAYK